MYTTFAALLAAIIIANINPAMRMESLEVRV
jgi:hypothetical protein